MAVSARDSFSFQKIWRAVRWSLEEEAEARVVDEVAAAAVGGGIGVGREPGDVFALVLLLVGELGHVDLGVRRRRCEEETAASWSECA